MADTAACSDVLSHILSKSNGNINGSVKIAVNKRSFRRTWISPNDHQNPTKGITSTTKNACGNDLVSMERFGNQVNTKEWSLVTCKNYTVKPNKGDKCETATSDQLIMTTNRFTALSNLEVNNADSSGLQEQSEWVSTQNMHKTKKQHRNCIKIPTTVNGRITHSDDRNLTGKEENDTCIWH